MIPRALLIMSSIVMVSSGCTARNDPAPLSEERNPYIADGRIQFEHSTTTSILKIVDVKPEWVNGVEVHGDRQEGDLLRITVTIRNRTTDDLWVDTRTTFLDQGGHVVDQTNWAPVHLVPSTVTDYVCTALSTRASDYQIIFRQPAKTAELR